MYYIISFLCTVSVAEQSAQGSPIGIEPSTIVAICALVVSILGLYLAVRYNRRTIRITEHHNRLSVRPSLVVHYYRKSKDNEEYALLKNEGLGPAYLKKIEYGYKGKTYFSMADHINENCTSQIDKIDAEQSATSKIADFVLSKDSEIQLFRIKYYEKINLEDIEGVCQLLEINIRFKSIYDQDYFYRKVLNQ